MVLVTGIQAHVWEGESILSMIFCLFWIYPSVTFGLLIFGKVIRDYRMIHYGLPAAAENAASPQ